jgi:peptidoglycan/LPS O-acetylase OafA/YrhL
MVMFLAGVLLFEYLANRNRTLVSSWVGLPALLVGLGSTLLPYYGVLSMPLRALLLFVGFGLSCYAVFRFPLSGFARALSWTPLRWLGNMSYSYYLLHGLALKASFLAISNAIPTGRIGPVLFWPGLPVLFVATLLPSAVLFLLVEQPFSLRQSGLGPVPGVLGCRCRMGSLSGAGRERSGAPAVGDGI